jgi:hypothetical protein
MRATAFAWIQPKDAISNAPSETDPSGRPKARLGTAEGTSITIFHFRFFIAHSGLARSVTEGPAGTENEESEMTNGESAWSC